MHPRALDESSLSIRRVCLNKVIIGILLYYSALKIGFQWFDKTTTRLPEALMFQFEPVPQPGNKWILSKLGQKVDPTNVILNGSQHQHGRITYCLR